MTCDENVRIVEPHQETEGEVILIEDEYGRLHDIGLSFLSSFADDADCSCGKIHAVHRQIAQLLHAQARGEHRFEDQAVSDVDDAFYTGISVPAADLFIVGGVDDLVDLLFIQRLRQERRFANADIYVVKRRKFQDFLCDSIFKKCVDDGFFLEDRGRPQACVKALDICMNIFPGNVLDFCQAALLEKGNKAAQCGGIGFYGMGRKLFLGFADVQIFVFYNYCFHRYLPCGFSSYAVIYFPAAWRRRPAKEERCFLSLYIDVY